jgi:hypothetical protein
MVFLSSLVVLIGMMLFGQLRRLEQRMAALEQPPREAADALVTIRTTNAEGVRFRWLERVPDRAAVFIPVLLGAGVVLSFLAYLVERIAGAVASATLDRRTVRALAPDLPLGSGVVVPVADGPRAGPAARRAMRVGGIVLTLVVSLVVVQALRELTQSRPGELYEPGTTTVVVEIGQKRDARPVAAVATDLWSSCRSRLGGDVELTAVQPLADQLVRIDLDRALGRTGRARLIGCLEDYTLDLVRADIVTLESAPLAAGG